MIIAKSTHFRQQKRPFYRGFRHNNQTVRNNQTGLLKTPEEKKLILSTIAENITFSGKTVNIELKETFKVLQNVKKTPLFASENNNLRTPENASITTKNGSFEPLILNGAPDGIRTHAYRNHNPRS